MPRIPARRPRHRRCVRLSVVRGCAPRAPCLLAIPEHVCALARHAGRRPRLLASSIVHAWNGIGHCAYPAYTTTLLLALVAMYMPLLATACCAETSDVAAAIAINQQAAARARAYALSVPILVLVLCPCNARLLCAPAAVVLCAWRMIR